MANDVAETVSAVAQLGGAVTDAVTSASNYQQQQDNLDYQKNLQQTLFQREDDAVQRRVADLKAAGLSPTLAAGSAALAGPVVSTQAPQLNLDGSKIGQGLSGAATAALDVAQKQANIDQTNAQTELLRSQSLNTNTMRPLLAAGQELVNSLTAGHIDAVEQDVISKKIVNSVQQTLSNSAANIALAGVSSAEQEAINKQLDGKIKGLQLTGIQLDNARKVIDNAVAAGTQSSTIASATQDLLAKILAVKMSSQAQLDFSNLGLSPAMATFLNQAFNSVVNAVKR